MRPASDPRCQSVGEHAAFTGPARSGRFGGKHGHEAKLGRPPASERRDGIQSVKVALLTRAEQQGHRP
jgi:hypothetical protein